MRYRTHWNSKGCTSACACAWYGWWVGVGDERKAASALCAIHLMCARALERYLLGVLLSLSLSL